MRWDEGVRQPVNTLSNLPFVLTGAHMLVLGATDTRAAREGRACAAADRSMLQHFPLFTFANGAAQLWVAAGSLLFHGSWTRAGQRVDMGAVYAALLCPAVYVAQRVGLLGPGGAHSSFATVLLAACIWFTANKWRVKSATMVPALIVLLVGLLLLWFAVGSPVADGGSVRRWLLGPVQRRRPDGLTWELLVGAALSIALAFGACVRWCARVECACRLLTHRRPPFVAAQRARRSTCRVEHALRAAGFSGMPCGTWRPRSRSGCCMRSSAVSAHLRTKAAN